jgi:hypothetical protein
MRYYQDEEQNKIHLIFERGGTLYFIERIDTNEFWYDSFWSKISHTGNVKDSNGDSWAKEIDVGTLSGAFLTKEQAENRLPIYEGGCETCGNGAKEIKCIVSEHEFSDIN